MTALTAAFDAKRKDGKLVAYPVGAGAKIFKGALACANTATGFVQTATDGANLLFVGVAYESVDNTGGAGGAKSIRLEKSGIFTYNSPTAAQTDVGKAVNIIDDNSVKTAATTNSIVAGTCAGYLDSGHLAVRIDGKVV